MKIFIDTKNIDETIAITELPLDTKATDSVEDFSSALACLLIELLQKIELKDTETLDLAYKLTRKFFDLYADDLYKDFKDDLEKHIEEAKLYGYMEDILEDWVVKNTDFSSTEEFVEHYHNTEVMHVSTVTDSDEVIISLKNEEVELEMFRESKKDLKANLEDADKKIDVLELIIVTALDKLFGEKRNHAREDNSWKTIVKESLK